MGVLVAVYSSSAGRCTSSEIVTAASASVSFIAGVSRRCEIMLCGKKLKQEQELIRLKAQPMKKVEQVRAE